MRVDTPAVATPEQWASLNADLAQAIRAKSIDAAVRAFLKLHHPLSWRLWLQNRDKRQLVSPLDLRDIRMCWREMTAVPMSERTEYALHLLNTERASA